MKLVLVRHGRTCANVSGALDTNWPGVPLDSVGQAQARALADRWVDSVASPPTAVAVSPLRRTRMTAAPLCERFGVSAAVRPGLREVRAGWLEMNADAASNALYHGVVASWTAGDLDVAMPGGESGTEVLGRALPAIGEEILRASAPALGGEGVEPVLAVVVHGSLIRLLGWALSPELSHELVWATKMSNTGCTVLQVPHGVIEALSADGSVDILRGSLTALTWNDTPVA